MTDDRLLRSPRVVKGGIVLVDPASGAVRRIITLQYNPDSLTRTLQVQGAGGGGDRSEALRLKGPPVETIKLEAEIDATDQLEFPEQHASRRRARPPPAARRARGDRLPGGDRRSSRTTRWRRSGTLEIVPMEAPLTLFVWSAQRILPVRLTEFSVTEEAFDPALNPIRAKVSLGMRVLTVDDLGFAHKGGSLFMAYLRAKEQLVAKAPRRGALEPRHRRPAMTEALEQLEAILVQAGVTVPRFPPNSRYHAHADHGAASGRTAAPSSTCGAGSCRRPSGSRCCASTLVAARATGSTSSPRAYLGDPEQFWRLCDANGAMRPDELTETVGRRLRITLPEGVPGASRWLMTSTSRC